ncbi:MAG TPA: hypothetical protein VHV53_10650 [Solirubrobacterales bacterium]|nr:hypothetical protein [Solirubrobacterales bacterium]
MDYVVIVGQWRHKQLPDLREIFLGELEGGEYRIKVAEGDPVVVEIAARNVGT